MKSLAAGISIILTIFIVGADFSHLRDATTETNRRHPPTSLRLVHVIYRHGDRAPMGPYPTDPNPDSIWPNGFAQLTKTGMNQQYQLGKFLRRKYNGFLSARYFAKEIYVRSTDIDRTLMSAETNLAGLYPPVKQDHWNKHLAWQPIPVHTVPQNTDRLLHYSCCPRADQLKTDFLKNSPIVLNKIKENKRFFDYLDFHAGKISDNQLQNAWKIGGTLYVEKVHNCTIPDWVTPRVWNKLVELRSFKYYLMGRLDEVVRLLGGNLLKKIIADSLDHIQGRINRDRKMFMYSAHDTLLAYFMYAMRVFDYRSLPPYAACYTVELHDDNLPDKEPYFKMWYRNDSTKPPYQFKLPGCSESCPVSKFIALTQRMIPIDIEEECKLKPT